MTECENDIFNEINKHIISLSDEIKEKKLDLDNVIYF
jgi:hypothetical protein